MNNINHCGVNQQTIFMKKIGIEIPDGHKEVIKCTDNGVVIE